MQNVICWLKANFIEYVVAFIIFLSIPPFFMWSLDKFVPIYSGLILLFSLLKFRRLQKNNLLFFVAISLLFFYMCIRSGTNILGFLAPQLLCSILLFPSQYLCDIFDKFSRIYALTIIPSIVMYVLVVLIGVNISYEILEPLNTLKSYNYLHYPFLLVTNKLGVGLFRFEAYYDEPGVVGTISGVLLLARGIQLRKWDTWAILVSGIISLSLAFYIMLFVNILMFQSAKVKIVLASILIFLGTILATNEVVTTFIFNRLTIEDGQLAGENRTSSKMDAFMEHYVNSDKFLFGMGGNYSQEVINVGGASYKDFLVNYGIIGFGMLLFFSLLFALVFLKPSKLFIIYLVIFGCVIYQRPFLLQMLYFFLLYISLMYMSSNCRSKS